MHKKILTSIVSLSVLFVTSLSQAAEGEAESPQEGLQAIVELYKNQDWEALVQHRCANSQENASADATEALVASLSSQFSDSETLSALVSSYEAALSAEPQIESEGTVAIFSSEVGSVKLSKLESGAWGLRF